MECSRCGTQLRRGLAICPVCGAQLRARPQTIRCPGCGYRSSAELTLCPRCGRARRPGDAWPTWGIGALIVVALALISVFAVPAFGKWRAALAERLPGDGDLSSLVAAALPTLESAAAIAEATAALAQPTPTEAPAALAAIAVEATATEPAPTPTLIPETATPTPLAPTDTPTPAPTVIPSPTGAVDNVYVVKAGDTPSVIARRLGVSLDDLMRVNNIRDATQLQVGQRLIIPASGEQAVVTPPADAIVYAVVAGDTVSTIARRFGVAAEEIMRANNIIDSTRLQINQQLIIPRAREATPTPFAPVATPTVTPTPTVALVYPAPQLLSPSDNTPFSGGDQAFIELRWRDVGPLQPGEVYVVHLGYLVTRDQISWFYEDTVQGTSWRVPGVFQSYAPQETGRAFRWYVQVEQIQRDAEGRITGRAVRSPRSAIWGFTWS